MNIKLTIMSKGEFIKNFVLNYIANYRISNNINSNDIFDSESVELAEQAVVVATKTWEMLNEKEFFGFLNERPLNFSTESLVNLKDSTENLIQVVEKYHPNIDMDEQGDLYGAVQFCKDSIEKLFK